MTRQDSQVSEEVVGRRSFCRCSSGTGSIIEAEAVQEEEAEAEAENDQLEGREARVDVEAVGVAEEKAVWEKKKRKKRRGREEDRRED